MTGGRTGGELVPAGAGRRVLVVGPRVAFSARLAAALRARGIGTEITTAAAEADPGELRGYGAVSFDRTVGEDARAAVRAAFAAAGSRALFVEPLAPVVPLVAAQLEQALHSGCRTRRRRLTGLRAEPGRVRLDLAEACRVRVTGYGSGRLRRGRARELLDDRLEAGGHHVALPRGVAFVVARTYDDVLVVSAAATDIEWGAGPPTG
ncbi:hypothetical protein BLA24_32905 [Streptomyces cinnamoneus]|uniref:Uncharacterized protein n=1 Tax=Streptomyces cinnamoneus TaxID=53446 RepID=A0A2G1XAL6_STRCJ|nr:hypothetical protein [Streptomyces cinnamoneus]PHQ48219.1 hypothetical protein BLA24_32905 [Streptomyces cinnamoneus]PPT15846.1 hypothetical protein CYQ11_25955 [Streptomyces cinnamoneus]